MIKIEKIKITLLAVLISVHVSAKENINYPGISNIKNERVAAGCTPSTSQTDLDVNNVRTTIMGGGDMWWNLDDARYEIQKMETNIQCSLVLYGLVVLMLEVN